jgi:peptide/nickel transport system permease protein
LHSRPHAWRAACEAARRWDVLVTLLALFAPWVTPYGPMAMKISDRIQSPRLAHWFGTDELGRDVFSRVVFGARYSLMIGALVVLISVTGGVLLGLVAGFFRRLDGPIMRFVDAMMSFPDILLAIALVAVLGASMTNVILALAIVYTPRVARVVRASTLVVRELLFIEAARALGVSTWRILFIHILNNIASPILVQATFIFAYAVLAEAGLSFLGVGVPPELPTWGTMIASGQQFAHQAIWLVVFPGVAIVLSALDQMGDALIAFVNFAIVKKSDHLKIDSIAALKGHKVLTWQDAYLELGDEFASLFAPGAPNRADDIEVANQEDQVRRFWQGDSLVIVIDRSIFAYFSKTWKDTGHAGPEPVTGRATLALAGRR